MVIGGTGFALWDSIVGILHSVQAVAIHKPAIRDAYFALAGHDASAAAGAMGIAAGGLVFLGMNAYTCQQSMYIEADRQERETVAPGSEENLQPSFPIWDGDRPIDPAYSGLSPHTVLALGEE